MKGYQVTITKENFKEVIVSIVNANKNCDYEPMCFSTKDVLRKIAADRELAEIEFKLEEAGVNLYEHLRPIYLETGQGWNYVGFPETCYENISKEMPEDLNVVVPCSALYSGVYDDSKHHYSPIVSDTP